MRPLLLALASAFAAVAGTPQRALATTITQYGFQERIDGATRALQLAIQQQISSLPPTAAQSFDYEFDPAIESYVRGDLLGPTWFRATHTVGRDQFAIRAAASYFRLDQDLGPITYRDSREEGQTYYLKLGSRVRADVSVLDFSGTYGLTNDVELSLTVPVVVVANAQAYQLASHSEGESTFGERPTRELLDANLKLPRGDPDKLEIRGTKFNDLGSGFDRFNDGTHVGVGRIDLGAKFATNVTSGVDVAAIADLLMPSPSAAEFAGSDSFALSGRLVASDALLPHLDAHGEAGYEYDTQLDELSRFVWVAGISAPFSTLSFDVGLGGSEYLRGVQFTPQAARGSSFPGGPIDVTATALERTRLGTTVVDVLVATKVRIAGSFVLTAAASIPVVNETLQPAAVGTLGVEYFF